MNTSKQINAMVVVLFLALITIGAYVVWDPFRSEAAEDQQLDITVERGATTFALNCRLCHGDRGEGGSDGGRLGVAPALDREGLQGIEGGTFTAAAHAAAFKLVSNTITCGRAGTAMPTWGATQGGTLNEEQIRQLTVLITQGTLADGRSTWELAQEHADEIDAESTAHAELEMPDGLTADAGEIVVSSAELFNRDQYIRIDEERLYIPGYRLEVQRAVNGSAGAEHEIGTAILEVDVETGETVKFAIAPEDTTIYVSGVRGVEVDDVLRSIDVGDTIRIGEEQMTVTASASGIPTTGQFLIEEIGRTPGSFLVSGIEGIEAGAVIRLNGELMVVEAIRDDGETAIEVDANVDASAETIAVSDPAFFGADYVMRIGDELLRVVEPVETGQALGDPIGRAETTFALSGTEGLEEGMIVRIDSELMRITELTPASIDVDRGAPLEEEGDETAPAAHDASTPILLTGVEEGEDPDTDQTLLEAADADATALTVSGTTGLAVGQTFQLGDEGVLVTDLEPARARVERAVEDTDLAHHTRRTAIHDGNFLEVERGFDGSSASAHDEGDPVNMFELEVERAAEGSELQEHGRGAEVFLGNGLMVVRGVKSTEPAEHEDGALVRNFPIAPDNPADTAIACGQLAPPEGPEPTAGPTPTAGAGTPVDVSLIEFEVIPDPTSVAGGAINFNVANDGEIIHNFRLALTDLAADDLPTSGGSVDEGELEVVATTASDLDSGGSETVAATLDAGSYVMFCNIVSHYLNGMYAEFEVTGQ
ncbi:MAG: cytochrome c [Dehalococcoidia bacterium]